MLPSPRELGIGLVKGPHAQSLTVLGAEGSSSNGDGQNVRMPQGVMTESSAFLRVAHGMTPRRDAFFTPRSAELGVGGGLVKGPCSQSLTALAPETRPLSLLQQATAKIMADRGRLVEGDEDLEPQKASSEFSSEDGFLREVVVAACIKLGRPTAKADALVRTLEEWNFGSRDTLEQLDPHMCEELGIPLRFLHVIKEELAKMRDRSRDAGSSPLRQGALQEARSKRGRSQGEAQTLSRADSSVPLISGICHTASEATLTSVPSKTRLVPARAPPTSQACKVAVERHIQRHKQAREAKLKDNYLRISSNHFEHPETSSSSRSRRANIASAGKSVSPSRSSPRKPEASPCGSPRRPDALSGLAYQSPRGPKGGKLAGNVLSLSRSRSSFGRIGVQSQATEGAAPHPSVSEAPAQKAEEQEKELEASAVFVSTGHDEEHAVHPATFSAVHEAEEQVGEALQAASSVERISSDATRIIEPDEEDKITTPRADPSAMSFADKAKMWEDLSSPEKDKAQEDVSEGEEF